MLTERVNGPRPCPQCGGPTIDDANGYHCRCGVKVAWAKWEGGEEGPPEASDDRFDGVLSELGHRLQDLRGALQLFRDLQLWDDGETHERRVCAAIEDVEKANAWLRWAKHRLGRYFQRGGGAIYGPGGAALALIDADAELKRVARGEPPPPKIKNWWDEL